MNNVSKGSSFSRTSGQQFLPTGGSLGRPLTQSRIGTITWVTVERRASEGWKPVEFNALAGTEREGHDLEPEISAELPALLTFRVARHDQVAHNGGLFV